MNSLRYSHSNGPSLSRQATLVRLLRLLVVFLGAIPAAITSPIRASGPFTEQHHFDGDPELDEASHWFYMTTAISLVLLGGAFAGLTIAYMGQDEINLQVIAASGDAHEKKQALRVLNLLRKGKHWVLVTLLLSNVITNETLPIILDRSLGGGWPAVVASTVLIVIFGEIVPQSICVRYGLSIGAMMGPLVLSLMWIMSPIAWPIARLLDYLLGKDHGTVYKKAGLKTLVTLHRTIGNDATERLNSDEVTIISSVLDLKDKTVQSIMTPIQDVYILSADTVLDEQMVHNIVSQGFSRIPVHRPENRTDFVGMLLVKTLVGYDPEDCLRVDDFSLATLPETGPGTSCLDIVNFFQEGRAHMALVSARPGEDTGALGVVTLEDVIEELIGEEIVDESDVYVDVPRAIRRLVPGPLMHFQQQKADSDASKGQPNRRSMSQVRPPGYLMRRNEGEQDGSNTTPSVRDGFKPQFGSIHPQNRALDPRSTQIPSIHIKGLSRAIHSTTSQPTHSSLLLDVSEAPAGPVYGTINQAPTSSTSLPLIRPNGGPTTISRTSSSSAGSRTTTKLIISSDRPASSLGSSPSSGRAMPVVTMATVDPPSRNSHHSTSRTGSPVSTVAVSGRLRELQVDQKLVITPVPVDENGDDIDGADSTVLPMNTTIVEIPQPRVQQRAVAPDGGSGAVIVNSHDGAAGGGADENANENADPDADADAAQDENPAAVQKPRSRRRRRPRGRNPRSQASASQPQQ